MKLILKKIWIKILYVLAATAVVLGTLLLWIPAHILSKVLPQNIQVSGTEIYVKYKRKLVFSMGFGF